MFEEKAINQANKKYPIPLVCDQLDFARNRKYEEGFKDGAEFVFTKAKDIIENLIDALEAVDGEQVEDLKVVKEAEKFLKEEF